MLDSLIILNRKILAVFKWLLLENVKCWDFVHSKVNCFTGKAYMKRKQIQKRKFLSLRATMYYPAILWQVFCLHWNPQIQKFKGCCVNMLAWLQWGCTLSFYAQVTDTVVTRLPRSSLKSKVDFIAFKVYLFFRFYMYHFNVFFNVRWLC